MSTLGRANAPEILIILQLPHERSLPGISWVYNFEQLHNTGRFVCAVALYVGLCYHLRLSHIMSVLTSRLMSQRLGSHCCESRILHLPLSSKERANAPTCVILF